MNGESDVDASRRRVALTIAGSDSGGGAGIQADLKTFEAFGVWGTSALTAITAQNTLGVHDALVLPPALVRSQLDAVATDFPVDACKTGMLGTAEVIEAVVDGIAAHQLAPVVVDPVLVTSHGERLLGLDALGTLRQVLLPLAAVVTPNLPEAEALLDHPIAGIEAMPEAAAELAALGCRAVLLKGGHLAGDRSPDLLWSNGEAIWLDGPRLRGRFSHGTGCSLSSAICAELASGSKLEEACRRAKAFVAGAIARGADVGHGVGPVDPGWRNRPPR
jgi:hydroxymethylpyrimidine/phosphomethylpyrimidine kinase